jgi:DNA-binding response OmpR family regulator
LIDRCYSSSLACPRQAAFEQVATLGPHPRGDDPFDRSIDSRITRLRRRLETDPTKPELIKTMRGAGYLARSLVKPYDDLREIQPM